MINETLVNEIMNIGEEMLKSGADSCGVENRVTQMVESYGAAAPSIYVIPNKIELSVPAASGGCITQTRKVKTADFDFDRLSALQRLSDKVCRETPDAQVMHRSLEEVMNRMPLSPFVSAAARVVGVVSFGLSFGCNAVDSLVGAVVCILVMVLFGDQLQRHEKNLFAYNFLLTFISAAIVAGCSMLLGTLHPFKICLGLIISLLGGLDVTNGIRDVINNDTFSGILNISRAAIGTSAIAFGVALAFVRLSGDPRLVDTFPDNLLLQTITAGIGTAAFGISFHTSFRQAVWIGVGSAACEAAYLLVCRTGLDDTVCLMLVAALVAAYSRLMAYIHKVPVILFLTTVILPFVPGTQLFFVMLGLIRENYPRVLAQGISLMQTCIAITLGYMITEVVIRNGKFLYGKLQNRKAEGTQKG